jgi:hypothetical protein
MAVHDSRQSSRLGGVPSRAVLSLWGAKRQAYQRVGGTPHLTARCMATETALSFSPSELTFIALSVVYLGVGFWRLSADVTVVRSKGVRGKIKVRVPICTRYSAGKYKPHA